VAHASRGIAQKDDARNSGQRPFQRLPGIVFWGVLVFFCSQAAFVLQTHEQKNAHQPPKKHLKNKSCHHHFLFWGSLLWKCSCMLILFCFPVTAALKYL
jgi:hypothetical protein